MEKIGEWAKEHPALVVAGVIIVGLGLFMLLGGGGSQAASSGSGGGSSGVDPNAVAYQESVNANSAAAASQASAQSYQLALATLQAQTGIAQQLEGDAAQIHQTDTAAQVANNANQLQFQLGSLNLTTQLEALKDTNATNVSITKIGADENTAIAGINGQVQIAGINANENVAVTQANDWKDVQIKQSNNAAMSGIVGTIAGLAGSIFGV